MAETNPATQSAWDVCVSTVKETGSQCGRSFPDSYRENPKWRQASFKNACIKREYVICQGEILMYIIQHGFVAHFEVSSRRKVYF